MVVAAHSAIRADAPMTSQLNAIDKDGADFQSFRNIHRLLEHRSERVIREARSVFQVASTDMGMISGKEHLAKRSVMPPQRLSAGSCFCAAEFPTSDHHLLPQSLVRVVRGRPLAGKG